MAIGIISRERGLRFVASSLLCETSDAPSDAILIDLVDNGFPLFVKAQQLQESGRASKVLVPILSPVHDHTAAAVAKGFVDVMCGVARVSGCETFQVPETEPFTLNLARRAAEELRGRGVRSTLIVTNGFRSRRAAAVYAKVFRHYDITIRCQPVFGSRNVETWSRTSHGIQDIVLQTAKLTYYHLVVLPRID